MTASSTASTAVGVEPLADRRALGDRNAAGHLFRWTLFGAATLVMVVLCAAASSMLWGGRLAFQTFGWHFIVSDEWDPVRPQLRRLRPDLRHAGQLGHRDGHRGAGQLRHRAVPDRDRAGVAAAPIAAAIELLAGIPSIIYGMWGLFSFVPFMSDYVLPWINDHLGVMPWVGALFRGPPLGIGMLTAGIVLGIMVIPFISSVMRDVFRTVPASLKESAYALGSTTWEVVWKVVLPYTRSAVVGGIFLGLGRALGETMAVTFVLGNAHQLSASLLAPGNSIAATIANEFTEADSDIYLSSLIALGFLLFVVTLIVLAIAKIMLLRLSRNEGN